jgi:murein endopeptidase
MNNSGVLRQLQAASQAAEQCLLNEIMGQIDKQTARTIAAYVSTCLIGSDLLDVCGDIWETTRRELRSGERRFSPSRGRAPARG